MKLIDYAEEWRAGWYISLGTEYTLTASSTENDLSTDIIL